MMPRLRRMAPPHLGHPYQPPQRRGRGASLPPRNGRGGRPAPGRVRSRSAGAGPRLRAGFRRGARPDGRCVVGRLLPGQPARTAESCQEPAIRLRRGRFARPRHRRKHRDLQCRQRGLSAAPPLRGARAARLGNGVLSQDQPVPGHDAGLCGLEAAEHGIPGVGRISTGAREEPVRRELSSRSSNTSRSRHTRGSLPCSAFNPAWAVTSNRMRANPAEIPSPSSAIRCGAASCAPIPTRWA